MQISKVLGIHFSKDFLVTKLFFYKMTQLSIVSSVALLSEIVFLLM